MSAIALEEKRKERNTYRMCRSKSGLGNLDARKPRDPVRAWKSHCKGRHECVTEGGLTRGCGEGEGTEMCS